VIFNANVSGSVTWWLITLANRTHEYTVLGALSGSWFTAQ
jgi:hypothetical protein